VDKAAKRIGRFDLQVPIYHPDPMSRVGVFLYRLITILQKNEKDRWKDKLREWEADVAFWTRVRETIAKTEDVSAQSLATIFFSTEAAKTFFNYVQDPSQKCPSPTQEKSNEDKKTKVEQDIETQRGGYEEAWKKRVVVSK
jgi:hypothetical protein